MKIYGQIVHLYNHENFDEGRPVIYCILKLNLCQYKIMSIVLTSDILFIIFVAIVSIIHKTKVFISII